MESKKIVSKTSNEVYREEFDRIFRAVPSVHREPVVAPKELGDDPADAQTGQVDYDAGN